MQFLTATFVISEWSVESRFIKWRNMRAVIPVHRIQLVPELFQLVLEGSPDPQWPKITLLTQKIMMACMESAENGRGNGIN